MKGILIDKKEIEKLQKEYQELAYLNQIEVNLSDSLEEELITEESEF